MLLLQPKLSKTAYELTIAVRIVVKYSMRKELLAWFAREGLVLTSASSVTDNPEHDDVTISVMAPLLALSRASHDFRECPDPVLFGYPASSLERMTLDDMHQFVLQWFEHAVKAGMARCFVCNQILSMESEKPWDVVFVTTEIYCWLLVHFDCKRYLNRDLKGRNPFEVSSQSPEIFELHLSQSLHNGDANGRWM